MSGLSEKHRELKRQRAAIVAKMGDIVKAEDDDKPLTSEQSTTFDELAAALAAIDQRLQRVAAAMQAAAEGASDLNDNGEGEGNGEGDDKGAGGGFRVRGATVPGGHQRQAGHPRDAVLPRPHACVIPQGAAAKGGGVHRQPLRRRHRGARP
jgi:hypothetical protein